VAKTSKLPVHLREHGLKVPGDLVTRMPQEELLVRAKEMHRLAEHANLAGDQEVRSSLMHLSGKTRDSLPGGEYIARLAFLSRAHDTVNELGARQSYREMIQKIKDDNRYPAGLIHLAQQEADKPGSHAPTGDADLDSAVIAVAEHARRGLAAAA
jgi:hypothetical protein